MWSISSGYASSVDSYPTNSTKHFEQTPIDSIVQIEEFLFGTLERRESLRKELRDANDRKHRMEKKLFLDLMQIGWNILQKSKNGVELFMPNEEFFSVDELFADVPELKKELFEAAERTDNDKLPEFIVYVNNNDVNRELITRVVNRCSQAIKNSNWPLYAKNHRIKNLDGDPYDDDDDDDDVCMVITCETQGDISYISSSDTWQDGNHITDEHEKKEYYIPEPPRKCIRVWLMFESQLKLMNHPSSWQNNSLISLKFRDWRLRLKNTHLWCLEHEKYSRLTKIIKDMEKEISTLRGWIKSIENKPTTEVDENIITYCLENNNKINSLVEHIKDLKKVITEPPKKKIGKKKLEQIEEQNKQQQVTLQNCIIQLNGEILTILKIEIDEKNKLKSQEESKRFYTSSKILVPIIGDRRFKSDNIFRLNSDNIFSGSTYDTMGRSCVNNRTGSR
jgi:hypothetical protein